MRANFCFPLLISLISVTVPILTRAQNGGGATVELWCVAKNNADDSALQTALDWACGPGDADCGPIQQGEPCYDSSDILRTASFAFNSYFLEHGATEDSCNFDNTAALTSLNPSYSNCKFPSSSSSNNGSFSGSTLGPASADLSSSSDAGVRWFRALIYFRLCSSVTYLIL